MFYRVDTILLDYLVECRALYNCYFIHLYDLLSRIDGMLLLLLSGGKFSSNGHLFDLQRETYIRVQNGNFKCFSPQACSVNKVSKPNWVHNGNELWKVRVHILLNFCFI